MSTAVAKKSLRQVTNVKELLVNENAASQLAKVAANKMNPERMMRVVANSIRTTPQLQDSDPMSLLGALMHCASLGLEPNTPLGHAYLIPFRNTRKNITEVQVIIGYKGFADLARRTGQVRTVHADVVYDDDELWTYEYGSDMHLRHKPGPREGKKTHAYCYVKLEDGEAFVVLPWAEVMKTRNQSQGYRRAKDKNSHPWVAHEDRMAAKTALRALANRGEMPMSIEFADFEASDDMPMDFASFAANPDDGLTIDGELVDEDGVVTSPDDEGAPEPEPQAIEKEKPAPKAQERAAPAKKAEPSAPRPEGQDGLDLAGEKGAAKYVGLRDTIINDLLDGDPDEVMGVYKDQLADMAKNAPSEHSDVIEVAKDRGWKG